MIFRKLYEDLGSVKADIINMHEKQDRLLKLLDEQCIKRDEFTLFKRISFSAASVFIGALAFMFSKVL